MIKEFQAISDYSDLKSFIGQIVICKGTSTNEADELIYVEHRPATPDLKESIALINLIFKENGTYSEQVVHENYMSGGHLFLRPCTLKEFDSIVILAQSGDLTMHDRLDDKQYKTWTRQLEDKLSAEASRDLIIQL